MRSGRDLLVVGQSSGVDYGVDPEREGTIVWDYRVGHGKTLGGIEWEFAVDGDKVFFADSGYMTDESDGLSAVYLQTGEAVWSAQEYDAVCGHCDQALLAAATAIPYSIFSDTYDGFFRAYSSENGSVFREYDTNGEYDTVNAKGGSITGPGPIVVDGMVCVNSGCAAFDGRAGNVLLAFGVD